MVADAENVSVELKTVSFYFVILISKECLCHGCSKKANGSGFEVSFINSLIS